MEEIGYLITVKDEKKFLYDIEEMSFVGIYTRNPLEAKFMKYYSAAEGIIERMDADQLVEDDKLEIIKVKRTIQMID